MPCFPSWYVSRIWFLSSAVSVQGLLKGEGKAALGTVAAAWSFSQLHQHHEYWDEHFFYQGEYRTIKYHCGNKFQLCHDTCKTLDMSVNIRGSVFPFISEKSGIASPASLTFFSHHLHLQLSPGAHWTWNLSSEVTQCCTAGRPALTPGISTRAGHTGTIMN